MSRPQERLAERLARAETASEGGVIRSADISRADRDALTAEGWLTQIIRGWYLLSTPAGAQAAAGSTAWFGSLWTFVRLYLDDRVGEGWCLSAADSLALHAGDRVVPRQITALIERGGAHTLELPYGVSLLTYPDPTRLPAQPAFVDGLRLMRVEAALLRAPLRWYQTHGDYAAVLLAGLPDPLAVAREALSAGPLDGLGRVAGAFRAIGRGAAADQILAAAGSAGRSVVETDPFPTTPPVLGRSLSASPYGARVRGLWERMRTEVLDTWPPSRPLDPQRSLATLDERATADAWHSLSIEGFRVTPELIERIREAGVGASTEDRDRLAAAGYSRAWQEVRAAVLRVLDGGDAAIDVEARLASWYQTLYAPHAEAGLVDRADLFGYRRQPVFILGSRHVPPPSSAVAYAMESFAEQLADEPSPAVRAVLGHFLFTWIHPYPDGNGRLGRFLMNLQLASGGYPWTVIRVQRRSEYMAALEAASVDGDIGPFARFVREEMESEPTLLG